MAKIGVRLQRLSADATLPSFGSSGASGCDLYASISSPVVILPGATEVIPLGFSTAFPDDYVALLFARSGTATKQGLAPANKVGVIDPDYRGEWKVALLNHGLEPRTVSNRDRIAQVVFVESFKPEFEVCDCLPETERGAGGFGSTGR